MDWNEDAPTQVDEVVAPAAPPWAYLLKDTEYVPADQMHSGDTIYLSKNAYPRVLWTQLSRTSWSVMVMKPGNHYRYTMSIEPAAHYVIKRATRK